MKDYIVRATAGNAQIRAFAAVTTNLVEEAREHHGTSPVATAALGRLLTGGVMMGSMMKNDTDMLTIQIQCSGQIEGLTVTADSKGNVKGYAFNPDVMLPAKNGKLDVGGALGQGVMTIIKDMDSRSHIPDRRSCRQEKSQRILLIILQHLNRYRLLSDLEF